MGLCVCKNKARSLPWKPDRSQVMYPAAVRWCKDPPNRCYTDILSYWAHLDGYPEYSYLTMKVWQLQINQGYMTIANQLIAPVPRGYALVTAWLQISTWFMERWQPSQ